MELTFFIIFLSLSLLLIFLGLFRNEHSELAIIGFLFLFLLSFLVIGSDIQYKTGTNTTSTVVGNVTTEVMVYNYADMDLGGTFSHSFGYWLAILSVVGFIAVLAGLRRDKW